MLYFLITTILFVYIFVFIARAIVRLIFGRFTNNNGNNYGNGQTTPGGDRVYYQNEPKKKHFKPTDGEYVDFEEIE